MHDPREHQDLLLVQEFSNEIDDLPKPGEYRRKTFTTPDEVQVELDRSIEQKEAKFRKWLRDNKPRDAVMVPIETNTVAGVPDMYSCYEGFSSWLECKVLCNGSARIRSSQFLFFKKLVAAGGHGKLVIQKISTKNYKPSSIVIYDAASIVAIPIDMFKPSGQHLIVPPNLTPYHVWKYDKNTQADMYLKLLLDTKEFI